MMAYGLTFLIKMKLIKFLLCNFQIINFFFACVVISIMFSWWYIPKLTKNYVPNNLSSLKDKSPKNTIFQENLIPKNNNFSISEKEIVKKNISPSVSLPSQPSPSVEINSVTSVTINTYLGHFPFAENPQNRLVNMGKYHNRTEYLDQETAFAFNRMKDDAKAQGVKLVLISGFRTITSQHTLFQRQIRKRGSKEAAAKLSAPPGYSEHHTGYALDIGDGKQPYLDLQTQFESSQAYLWLANNAYKYGFELSFPKNNRQGVSFEPWHWRYVISDRANEIFAIPRSINNP